MGAGDRLVAVGTYDRFPPEVDRLPRVGALLDPNVERILSLRPDLVILLRHADRPAPAARPRARAVLLLRPPRPAGHHADHPLARRACRRRERRQCIGRSPGAAAGGHSREGRKEPPAEDAPGVRPRAGDAQKHRRERRRRVPPRHARDRRRHQRARRRQAAVGDDEHRDGAGACAGSHHRAALRRGTPTAPKPTCACGTRCPPVPAVRNHRVYLLQGEEFVVPGPRVVLATDRLARTLHPELFK